MSIIYVTADTIGTQTGGGLVTAQESRALREFSAEQTISKRDPMLSSVNILHRDNLSSNNSPEPWKWDAAACEQVGYPKLAHFYSGTWPITIPLLKGRGTKVCITIAAHDKEISRQEHEKLGIPFPYDHLVKESLWQRYIIGYRLSDVIVSPSTISETTIRRYGADFEQKRIEIIPHGCAIPSEVAPISSSFALGYMGSCGAADKGVVYLLAAWKKLGYKDGSRLVLAGRDSNSPWVGHLIAKYGGGSIHLAGWQNNTSDFYNSISCYCQSSTTEGFGLEVLESMAHSRMALCSKSAGAQDIVHPDWKFDSCNVDVLADLIDATKKRGADYWTKQGKWAREQSRKYEWAVIRRKYIDLWSELL